MATYRKHPEAVLTPEQYRVMHAERSKHPFLYHYSDSKEPGLTVSGEALFASSDKFDAVTGRPRFAGAAGATAAVGVSEPFFPTKLASPWHEVNLPPLANSPSAHCAFPFLVDAKADCKHQYHVNSTKTSVSSAR